tara:strand:+ start:561 stop:722 length:162 start_codon:yes stop_codon:yes gene_type:complete
MDLQKTLEQLLVERTRAEITLHELSGAIKILQQQINEEEKPETEDNSEPVESE